MSKNTNLSFLTDFLTADIVNSRVGMNNASPQSTFDVTGTGKFSGILTLGSTVSNGTYTYTLPSATGTLALTSDIPVVTGYVPYTGATTSVDLGDNVLTSGGLNIDSLGGYGGALNLRQATSFSLWTGAPYTSIYATTGNRVVFMFSNDNRTFTLDGSLVSAASPRTFTFPDATGTFALTSQIPTNAVGGTGTLNTIPKFTAATTIGNSNIFDSGSIIYNTNPAAGQFAWQFNGSTVTGQSYGAQVIAGTNASDTGFRVMNAAASINYLVVRGDGLVTLTGALNGTSATFGGLITGQTTSNATITQNFLAYNSGTSISGASYDFASGGTAQTARISANYEASSPDRMAMRFLVGQGSGLVELLKLYNNTMTVTGAATFSSTIAASGRISTSHSTSGDYAAVFYNSSATGEGVTVRGGSTASHNAFIVQPYNGATTLFNILATGAATFSSSVTASKDGAGNLNTNTTGSQLILSRTAGGAEILGFRNTGASNGIGGTGYTAQIISDGNNAVELYTVGGSPVIFGTSATERMRITSTGNVGIGTDAPLTKLHMSGGSTSIAGVAVNILVQDTLTAERTRLQFENLSTGAGLSRSSAIDFKSSTVSWAIGTDIDVNAGNNFYIRDRNASTRLLINGSGNVGIGTTSPGTARLVVHYDGANPNLILSATGTSSFGVQRFTNDNGIAGSISMYATSVGYNTSSDYRLKQDLKEYNGLSLVSAIKTYDYEWKVDNKRAYGVLAHELQEVLPQAVFGEKDAEEMQGVDYSKLVPIMIKAIQEQQVQIQELKNKLS